MYNISNIKPKVEQYNIRTKILTISMASIFVCILLLVLFVINSQLVISGASYGLMLWYKNVLPMLLPFMLISGIIVRRITLLSPENPKAKSKYGILTTIFLGVLCGYPLGAKTCADFVANRTYTSTLGNIILPLCNNSSPMFISGYIVARILNNNISLINSLALIYVPYIIVTLISALIYYFSKEKNISGISEDNYFSASLDSADINQYLTNTINQITLVGLYIMICSIGIEFIMSLPYIPYPLNTICSAIVEITRGTHDIALLGILNDKTKTALILALTSFGGVSSILQTQMVIQKSGLSVIYYTVIKGLCAFFTYILCILFV